MTGTTCDHCGLPATGEDGLWPTLIPVHSLPVNVNSANEGDPANLCHRCHWFVLHAAVGPRPQAPAHE